MVHIVFVIDYKTHPGQVIRVCGSSKELGNWTEGYTMTYKDGKCIAEVDISTIPFEYKFQVYNCDGHFVEQWESCENRLFILCKQADEIVIESVWNYPDGTKITAKRAKIVKSTIKKSCSQEFADL
ncbi:hypothetical protein EDI_141000 [Entamoeba dispar SAW760]|uniref:CBM20 domain-containing protein n=1 Tax=Entamoeba dispar (strain ATCC PRA-260 / SAW760) TaxID=370354 RepID=B0EDW3_ENTDS|nr:uncharacterized protein EDI_141000 [Entamoeba dispar SAW760]EDR27275.1 hypothetical protein EDI_141000 [Entamoeba dispar SAW760]|eukprot:EDR27275.1 hypothetical protein EDI_141000 [Entamoeba dispar SAW760]